VKESWNVPAHQTFDHRDVLIPFRAEETLPWKLKTQ
jgi:hypothetical protein